MISILVFGDIVGSQGRNGLKSLMPTFKKRYQPDFLIANYENCAGGMGITPQLADELFDMGFHVLTGGNHSWDKKEIFSYMETHPYLLRPMNYPGKSPGKGVCSYTIKGKHFTVANLECRLFMKNLDCPFRAADSVIQTFRQHTDFFLFDIHGETSSEKNAFGWYLDGRAAAVFGTHTHIQTADNRLLTQGTAYISDLGMCGPYNSVIGLSIDSSIERFLTQRKTQYKVAHCQEAIIQGAHILLDENTQKPVSIERIQERVTLA